jgi:hypothetical protein
MDLNILLATSEAELAAEVDDALVDDALALSVELDELLPSSALSKLCISVSSCCRSDATVDDVLSVLDVLSALDELLVELVEALLEALLDDPDDDASDNCDGGGGGAAFWTAVANWLSVMLPLLVVSIDENSESLWLVDRPDELCAFSNSDLVILPSPSESILLKSWSRVELEEVELEELDEVESEDVVSVPVDEVPDAPCRLNR